MESLRIFTPHPTTSDLQQESGTENGSKVDTEFDDDDASDVFVVEANKS